MSCACDDKPKAALIHVLTAPNGTRTEHLTKADAETQKTLVGGGSIVKVRKAA